MFIQAELTVNDTLNPDQLAIAPDQQDAQPTVKPSQPEREVLPEGNVVTRNVRASLTQKRITAIRYPIQTNSIAPPESFPTPCPPSSWGEWQEAQPVVQAPREHPPQQLESLRQKLLLPLPTRAEVKWNRGLLENGQSKADHTDKADSSLSARFTQEDSLKLSDETTNPAKLAEAVAAYNATIQQSNLEFLSNPPLEVLALREALSDLLTKANLATNRKQTDGFYKRLTKNKLF